MTEEKKDFIIKDKRGFSKSNQNPEETEKEPGIKLGIKSDAKNEPSKENTDKQTVKDTGASTEKPEAKTQLPEINFTTFIFSLNSSVFVQLGVIEDPSTGEKAKNLPIAKQTIDILGMLEEKTRGNLTEDEANFLKNILHDLRLRYVKEKK